jgi:hypothetical protein
MNRGHALVSFTAGQLLGPVVPPDVEHSVSDDESEFGFYRTEVRRTGCLRNDLGMVSTA